jgi:Na+/serine symporter
MCTCSLASKVSANSFPVAIDLCKHTPHGLSITLAADINTAGQAIAVIIAEINITPISQIISLP